MKVSINSDTAVSVFSSDKSEIKTAYEKIFASGISGLLQCIPHLCSESPLARPEFDYWMNMVYEASIEAGGEFDQCHCPLLTPVEFNSSHASFIHDDLRKCAYNDVFRAAGLWKCTVVVHPITLPFFSDETLWEEYLRINTEYFSMLLEYAEKYDVKIAAENLFDIKDAARHYCAEPEKLKAIVDSVNSPRLGVCIDTGHAFLSGYEPHIFTDLFKEKVYALHIHDNNGFSDQHNLPPFGNINWEKFMQSLKNIGYEGFFNYEVHGGEVYKMNSNLKAAYYKYAYEFAKSISN